MSKHIFVSCLGAKSFDLGQRDSLGFLVSFEGMKLLLDCGPYVMQSLLDHNLRASDIDIAFISHSHIDHTGGLPWLINSLVFEKYYKVAGETRHLTILGATWDQNHPYYRYIESLFPWLIAAGQQSQVQFLFKRVSQFEKGSIRIAIFPVSHTVDNCGAEIRIKKTKIVYVPDTDLKNAAEWQSRLTNADLVIFSVAGSSKDEAMAEAYGFTTTLKAAQTCKRLGVQRVWFFHVYDDADLVQAQLETVEILGPGVASFVKKNESLTLSI